MSLALRDVAIALLVILLAITRLEVVASASHSVVIYFNGGCSTCVGYVETLEYDLRSVGISNIAKRDYSTNATALGALSSMRQDLGVPQEFFGSVTTVVDGRYLFEGFFPVDIMISFVDSNPSLDKLIAAQGLKPDNYRLRRDDVTLNCSSSQEIEKCLSSSRIFIGVPDIWALVLVSGFVDGLNPCAFAVLAYFVGVIALHRSREEILKIGTFYILSIYLVYLGMGLGLMQAVLSSGIVQVVAKVLGLFVVAVAILNLRNAFRPGSSLSLKIPKKLISPIARRFSSSWIQRSTVVAALLFGGIVAAIELPCTGAMYAAITGILSLQRTNQVFMLYSLGYSLMFVMPLIVLLILLSSVSSSSSLTEMIQRKKRVMKFASGLVMLGLGIFLLLA